MEKVILRAERARRHAVRMHEKTQRHKEGGESWSRSQSAMRTNATIMERIKQARKNRQVDWAAGRLAPRRDVGELKNSYGTSSIYDIHTHDRDPATLPKWWHLMEGDRVVVTKGRERGKIGEVRSVDKEKATVSIRNVNMVDVDVPAWANQEDQDGEQASLAPVAVAIPIEDVKLVYPIRDATTGIPRDVIIDRLEKVRVRDEADTTPRLLRLKKEELEERSEWEKRRDKKELKKAFNFARAVPGTNLIIPWPAKAETDPEVHDGDTQASEVNEVTFKPFLLYYPAPVSLIDELRNKYSQFRTRHQYDWVIEKEKEDERVAKRSNLVRGMRTPLQQLAELRAQQKRTAERELTTEQLARIGDVIAQEQARAIGAAKRIL